MAVSALVTGVRATSRIGAENRVGPFLAEENDSAGAPGAPGASCRVTRILRGAYPIAGIGFSFPSAKNPMNLPSGDQNGFRAPSVLDRGCIVCEFEAARI